MWTKRVGSGHRRLGRLAAVAVLLVPIALLAAQGGAQRPPGRRLRGGVPDLGPDFPTVPVSVAARETYDGSFRFCRIAFRNSPDGDGDGWYVDYPRADENLSIRFSELTKAPVSHDVEGNPLHLVLRLTDPELFQCPFVMMTEPGGAYFDDQEAAQLRTYLLKGGFLWADDFWGHYAFEWWAGQIGKALPPNEYPIFDVPLDHPVFHTLFNIDHIPQVPNIGLWMRSQITSERGQDSAVPEFRGISDHKGRLIVVMTHNTDFGDAYEQESVSPDYFHRFSVLCYAIGADVLLYAMTH
jgi:hypothetical protein